MNTIIIKLYTQVKLGEFSDVYMDEFESLANEMKRYAKQRNGNLYFAAISRDTYEFPVDNDCFAEVEYTDELQNEDKQYYISSLRRLATDGSIDGNEMISFETLKFVKFRKISDEIIML